MCLIKLFLYLLESHLFKPAGSLNPERFSPQFKLFATHIGRSPGKKKYRQQNADNAQTVNQRPFGLGSRKGLQFTAEYLNVLHSIFLGIIPEQRQQIIPGLKSLGCTRIGKLLQNRCHHGLVLHLTLFRSEHMTELNCLKENCQLQRVSIVVGHRELGYEGLEFLKDAKISAQVIEYLIINYALNIIAFIPEKILPGTDSFLNTSLIALKDLLEGDSFG